MVAFSLSSQSSTAQALLNAGNLVIHLPRHSERSIAEICAIPSRDRFGSDLHWEYLPTGEPRYKQIGSWFRAEVKVATPVEGATLVAAHLVDGNMADDVAGDCADTLVYHQRQWRRLDPSAPIPPTGHKSLSSSYLDLWA
jgi:flavin reductase (DIM6/NTAB) family NADH-FMN oxidoreductase RutF